jgi:aromatic ring-opening dioxygenase LigB subunit
LPGVALVDDDLRERAGECGYRSILIASGSIDESAENHESLSYEAPFGVGYLVAVLGQRGQPGGAVEPG